MLPAPPTLRLPSPLGPGSPAALPSLLFRLRAFWQAMAPSGWQRGLSLLLPLVLMVSVCLSGCQGLGQPPRSVLLQALALQIELTQGAIAQALDLQVQGLPEVNRVRVEEQQAIRIGESRGLRLAGRFDWRLPGDPFRVDSPFELYLVRGEKGQSWRLARPVGGTEAVQEWRTDPLPLKGERTAGIRAIPALETPANATERSS
ncbi:MAG: hypothetical protein ACKOCM_06455 [Cyanobacteriota bacterium]